MKKRSSFIVIQIILMALFSVYAIIQKLEADKQRERADWMQLKDEESRYKVQKLRHEIDSLKKLLRNSDK